MIYVLVNKQTGNYYMRDINGNEEGRCIDTDNISKAKKFDNYKIAVIKSRFIGGTKYDYIVKAI